MDASRPPHAATELADGPEAAAAGEQPEDSDLAETNGPLAAQGVGQPADLTADQEATEAIATPLESGQLFTRSSPPDGHHFGSYNWDEQSPVQDLPHNVGSRNETCSQLLWPLC